MTLPFASPRKTSSRTRGTCTKVLSSRWDCFSCHCCASLVSGRGGHLRAQLFVSPVFWLLDQGLSLFSQLGQKPAPVPLMPAAKGPPVHRNNQSHLTPPGPSRRIPGFSRRAGKEILRRDACSIICRKCSQKSLGGMGKRKWMG